MTTYRYARPGHPQDGEFFEVANAWDADTLAPEDYRRWLVPDTPIGPTLDAVLSSVRNRRTALLAASDWTQLPDVLLTAEQVTAWREYRQALRAWPDTVTDPWNPPPFPKPPAA